MVVTLLLPLTLSPHPITKEAAKPGIGRAEAHRRAMMALIDDTDHPHYAHPLFWAPFVVGGEGGSALH